MRYGGDGVNRTGHQPLPDRWWRLIVGQSFLDVTAPGAAVLSDTFRHW